MRIAEIQVLHARIPLKQRIKHASHSRTENDSILVRCRLDDGSVGWGEGLPRLYVTGETIDTAWQHLTEFDLSRVGQGIEDLDSLRETVAGIQLPRPVEARECFGNSARCALELAILDAACRSLQVPLSAFISQLPSASGLLDPREEVHYSAVMTATNALKLRIRCWLFRYYGFRQCKVKVGVPGRDDRKLLSIVRRIFGPQLPLRIDANEAWDVAQVADRLGALEPFQVESVEQPVPHEEVRKLREVRRDISVPIMLDESLCSREDAERAIQEELCDIFNLRLSKCGGILNSVELARLAQESGLRCQLGCQVGETGILSAAGRHFATTIGGLTAVEGSFDRFLVRERLTHEDLTFGREGRGEALRGPGLGVTIDEDAVERVCVRRAVRTL
ncbi:mandelate racemase/muconate lactonizing enzyme family protein [Planctomicrobium sp. SH661]|uniref:mandelate racemase/muconate lactonizing enzyme family protein n=1 Tax=Planctomicrobium sp. SH661 TaxID=3448124 RepID=UPI003F5C3E61